MFKSTIGAKHNEAKKNLNKVSEIESITPESLEEAIKEPATKKVARSTKKWALSVWVKKNPLINNSCNLSEITL